MGQGELSPALTLLNFHDLVKVLGEALQAICPRFILKG